MESPNQDDSQQLSYHAPKVGECLRHAWKVMWDNIGMILALSVLALIATLPSMLASFSRPAPVPGDSIIAYYLSLPMLGSLLYSFLVSYPVGYGYAYSLIKANRHEQMDVSYLFEGFKDYGNVLLGALLTYLATMAVMWPFFVMAFFMPSPGPNGLPSFITEENVLTVIPLAIGIFFLVLGVGTLVFVRISFVPYLIMDRKMRAVDAFVKSWTMTRGYTFTIFGLLVASMFIYMGGFLCFIVGIIPAVIWTQTAYASMYNAISAAES